MIIQFKEESIKELTFNKEYKVVADSLNYYHVLNNNEELVGYLKTRFKVVPEIKHFCLLHGRQARKGLNSWEFDIIKLVLNSRKKGEFEQNLNEVKDLIDLYKIEYAKNGNS